MDVTILKNMSPADFNRHLRKADWQERIEAQKSNDRFILAMAKAARAGRENVVPGTFVDLTPPVFAKRIQPEMTVSGCGSPAHMCLEAARDAVGPRSIK